LLSQGKIVTKFRTTKYQLTQSLNPYYILPFVILIGIQSFQYLVDKVTLGSVIRIQLLELQSFSSLFGQLGGWDHVIKGLNPIADFHLEKLSQER
jgi:hypothetical protein